MPLTPGAPVADTIRELYHSGKDRPRDQIIAIAESNHRRRADGGMAHGGFAAAAIPPKVNGDEFHPEGLFHSDVAGRTDRLPRAVPADSFVVPADVVSGLGQGNTLAGEKILDGIVTGSAPQTKLASGGQSRGVSHVMVAGGEYCVPRDKIEAIGHRMRVAKKSKARTDLAAGHEALRGLVERVRAEQKKFLASAPKPKS